MTAFQQLVKRYADGRALCNCRDAYCDKNGRCAYGCSANQIFAKEEVGRRALKEITELQAVPLKP